ncbi:MAG: hypothetical protein KC910_22945, partial [Candidatus Eremiobacteraeota bacterium]|nr:hypothetical protein [Candidatus Eremiobacteraeota bacterium]
SSEGFQDIASQPASLDDFPVLYGTAPDHQMRANLLTGEVALSPGTSFEVAGDLTVTKGMGAPNPHLKFGHTMNDEGETSFDSITEGSLSALDDPAAHSSALVASGNLNIGGIASGFGSIYADRSVQLQAKRGLRADPDLAVAVRGESISLTAEDPPDSAVANTLLETDWKVYQEALGPGYDSFDGWFEQTAANRRRVLGDDPTVATGLRTKNLPGNAASYWNQLDAELDLGPAPNFSAPPFGSDWTGAFTLEHYARLRNYATSKKSGKPVNQWLDFDGTYFQNVLGNIDSTILTYSNWASRLDMSMSAYMAEEVPLVPDVYFVGLVHAGGGGFFADLTGASILFEGAVVSQGRLNIQDARELDFVYNRLYLDDVVQQFVGDRVKLDQVYFNIL